MKRRIVKEGHKSYKWIYNKLKELNDTNAMLIKCDTKEECTKVLLSLNMHVSRAWAGKLRTTKIIHTNNIYVTLKGGTKDANGNIHPTDQKDRDEFPR